MERFEAQLLLKNLLSRVETRADGSRALTGKLTDSELSALRMALELLSSQPTAASGAVTAEPAASSPDLAATEPPGRSTPESRIELNLGALTSPEPPENTRLCLDFGTAMSKATLVHDDDRTGVEEIHVLKLGVPGDQEEISEVMRNFLPRR